MEKYQIIPRKFRPRRFDEVVGHEPVVQTLKNALKEDRVAQAYVFCGGRGCGKTTLARILAKALNCTNRRDDQEPCNECVSCIEILNGQSLNVLEIDGASNRGIDDIRQINETVGYAPASGGYKIYIIDEVHMLTKEAFNALLKTLEEPPAHVKFFFATTEPHKIPQTILSRCQRFDLKRINDVPFVEKLKIIASALEVDIEEDALEKICHLSEGSLRDGESLLDQLICHGKSPITLSVVEEVFGLVSNNLLFALDEAIHTEKLESAFTLAKEIYQSGRDIHAALDRLLEHFRSYLLITLGETPSEKYAKWAPSYTRDHLLYLLDTLITWQNQMRKAPFKEVHLEMLLLNLVRSKKQTSLDDLVQRLIALEEGKKPLNKEEPKPIQKKEKPAAVQEKNTEAPPENRTPPVSRNNLNDQKFDKDAAQNFSPERAIIAEGQGTGEDRNSKKKQPQSKTDSSSCFGIKQETPPPAETTPVEEKPSSQAADAPHPSQDDTLIRFAAVELEGTVTQQRS